MKSVVSVRAGGARCL